MDLRQHFYRFVYHLIPIPGQRRIVRSVNFQDLYSWEYDAYLKRPLWGLARHEMKTLTSQVGHAHFARRWGWALTLESSVNIE